MFNTYKYKKFMVNFGKNNQVVFPTEEDMYEVIGYLCNPNGNIEIAIEHNETSGAWAEEWRIRFFVPNPYPQFLHDTAGTGNVITRVNCNDFMVYLKGLGFVPGKSQNYSAIRNNIPQQYQSYFDNGYKKI